MIGIEIVYAMSLDGKISTADRKPWRWSDAEDHVWLLSRMAAADLLVVGAGTIRSENPSVTVPEDWSMRRQAEGKAPQPVRLVLSPSLSIAPDSRAVMRSDAKLIVAARPSRIDEKRDAFPVSVELLPWDDFPDLRVVLAAARERAEGGATLCLGGGRTNATFLEQDLVDRLSVTIASFVIGSGDAPGPFDGAGFSPDEFPGFRRVGAEPAGRDFVLRYERDRNETGRASDGGLR